MRWLVPTFPDAALPIPDEHWSRSLEEPDSARADSCIALGADFASGGPEESEFYGEQESGGNGTPPLSLTAYA